MCSRPRGGRDAARAWTDGQEAADTEREFATGVAGVIALDAAVSCAHECIQTLGGIGYTWEHDAHLYFRREVRVSGRARLRPGAHWPGAARRRA